MFYLETVVLPPIASYPHKEIYPLGKSP